MTASVLKQDPETHHVLKVRKNVVSVRTDETQHANFRGNPLSQATKRHFNSSGGKRLKNEMESRKQKLE